MNKILVSVILIISVLFSNCSNSEANNIDDKPKADIIVDTIIYYPNSKAIASKGRYLNGTRDGEWISYYENGQIGEKFSYGHGLRQGPRISYYKNGSIAYKGNYVDGKRTGMEISYYENGSIHFIHNWIEPLPGEQLLTFEDNDGEGQYQGVMGPGSIEYGAVGDTQWIYKDSQRMTPENNARRAAIGRAAIEKENKEFHDKLYGKESQEQSKYVSDGNKCTACGLGYYHNGFCNMCGAASKERVDESYSKAAKCEYCNGTGIVTTFNNETKVCPSCKGTGKQIN